jgi:glutamate N-acetyltransferase / amino-acid N-acetyltransferase
LALSSSLSELLSLHRSHITELHQLSAQLLHRALPTLPVPLKLMPLTSLAMARPASAAKRLISHLSTQIRRYAAPGEGSIPPSKKKYVPTSGSYPLGFLAASAHVGVKASNTRFDDLALVASETPCAGAAVFTKNKFQAAPVTVTRDMLARRGGSGIKAVVVNSGCANAVTGRGGIEDAVKMGEETDRCFGGEGDGLGSSTIVMSTGVIGQR